MATHTNAGNNENLQTDIGSPTLGASDIINVVRGDVNHSTTLTPLGTTAFAEFNTGPGYRGNLGNYPSGFEVNAGIIRLADRGRRHAIRSKSGHTVDELEWKNLSGGELLLHDIDTLTLLKLLAAGVVTLASTCVAVTVNATAPGLTVYIREDTASPVTAVTHLRVGGSAQGRSHGFIERDAGTITVNANGEVVAREACSPTTVNNNGGLYKHESSGAVGTINAEQGAVFDFSAAVGDSSSITWNITGDITIVEPPEGITIDLPTTAERGGYRVTYKHAA